MSFFDYPDARTRDFAGDDLITVLDDLGTDDWDKVLNHAQTLHFKVGERLIEQGDVDDALYILIEGDVEVVMIGSFGRERVMHRIGAGSVFGEMAFFDGRPRSASIRAATDGNVLRLTREAFDRLAAWEPTLARRLLFDLGRVLAARLRQSNPNVG